MSAVQELLRQSDPLARESGPTSSARAHVRAVVVRAGTGALAVSKPRRWLLRDGLALASLLLLIRLFQQATICSVGAWRAHRFPRICGNSSANSRPRRPVRTTWLRVAGRTGSCDFAAGTRAAIA